MNGLPFGAKLKTFLLEHKMRKLIFGIGVIVFLFLGACVEGPATVDNFGYKGTGIAFAVSPLTLDTLVDACYSFTVVNGATPGQLVVGRGPGAVSTHDPLMAGTTRNSLCANRFGNGVGGDISYLAPCDADQPAHTVRLWVDALCTGAVTSTAGTANWQTPNGICPELQSYVNPCGSAGCTLAVTCAENADTPVTFNFTIMAQADQGFFDIGVNFEDVFCSAKLDTCYSDNSAIMLLHDAASVRAHTAVAAVACSAGPGANAPTFLHFSAFSVICGATTYTLDLGAVVQEGSLVAPNPTLAAANGSQTLIASTWFGNESLPDMNKVFTNVAFVLPAVDTCSVSWTIVPSDSAVAPVPSDGTDGIFNYVAAVHFDGAVNSVKRGLCSRYPLTGAGTGVGDGVVAVNSSPLSIDTAALHGGLGVVARYFDVATLPPYQAALGFSGVFTSVVVVGVVCNGVTCPTLTDYTAACNSSAHCEYARTSPTATWHADDVWIYVPAGNFPMGGPTTDVGSPNHARPVHTVTFAQGFFIGKYEITTRTYEACEGAASCTLASVSDWNGNGWYLNRTSSTPTRATHPQNGVTWAQAGLVCAWVGGRRLTEAEWEYAAKGPTTHRRYPWGDTPEPTCANGTAVMNDGTTTPVYGCGTGGTWPVGEKAEGLSAVGALDMAGNLFEWVEDCWHDDYTNAPIDGSTWTTNCTSNSSRVLRGGSFFRPATYLRADFRINDAWTQRRAGYGTRCLRPLP